MAKSFHIWYIASSRAPITKVVQIMPLGSNWPYPWSHNFTLNYIRKTSNNFTWTAIWEFDQLNRWTKNIQFSNITLSKPIYFSLNYRTLFWYFLCRWGHTSVVFACLFKMNLWSGSRLFAQCLGLTSPVFEGVRKK